MPFGFVVIAILASGGAFALVTGPVTGFIIGLAGAIWLFVTMLGAHFSAKKKARKKKRRKKAAKAKAQLET